MIGDADSVKIDLAGLLNGPAFRTALADCVNSNGDGFMPQLPAAVYQYERLSKLVFPMAELIVYKENYPESETTVLHAMIEIGVRWTAVAKDERTVTRYVEVLAATTVKLLHNKVLQRVQGAPMVVREVDYSPLVPTAEHPYVKSALVLVGVETWRA